MRDKIRTDYLMLPKGLSRPEALALARKRIRKDFRGFKYNRKTGRAALT